MATSKVKSTKTVKAVGPTTSKAVQIRQIVAANADISIVEVIAKLAEKELPCRRSEVQSAMNLAQIAQ